MYLFVGTFRALLQSFRNAPTLSRKVYLPPAECEFQRRPYVGRNTRGLSLTYELANSAQELAIPKWKTSASARRVQVVTAPVHPEEKPLWTILKTKPRVLGVDTRRLPTVECRAGIGGLEGNSSPRRYLSLIDLDAAEGHCNDGTHGDNQCQGE